MSKVMDAGLKAALKYTERNPSVAQAESGNYAKGKFRWHGLEIAIENPKGSERTGVDKGGKTWRVKMPAHYGYVLGTVGRDRDHVDVYIGEAPGARTVFVIDQIDAKTGKFDEHKGFLNFASKDEALLTYGRAFSDGRAKDRLGAVNEMTIDQFKRWVMSNDTKKPLGHQAKGYATGGKVDMPLIKSGSKAAISSNIREMSKTHPRDQAIAAAMDTARRYAKASGGRVGYEGGGPIDAIRAWLKGQGQARAAMTPSDQGKELALTTLLGLSALPATRGPGGAYTARNGAIARDLELQNFMRPETRHAWDRGITGGEPSATRWNGTFDEGRIPHTSYIGSSGDLAARPGTTTIAPTAMPRPMPSNDPAPLHSAPDQGAPLASIHTARFLRALNGEPPLRVEMPKNLPPDWAVIPGDRPGYAMGGHPYGARGKHQPGALPAMPHMGLGAMPHMPRMGFAGGGWLGEMDSPAEVAPLPLPKAPRSVDANYEVPGPNYSGPLDALRHELPDAADVKSRGDKTRDLLDALAKAYWHSQGDKMRERAKMGPLEQVGDAGGNLADVGRNIAGAAKGLLPEWNPENETAKLSQHSTAAETFGDFARRAPGLALSVAPYAGSAEKLAAGPTRSLADFLYGSMPRALTTSVAPQAISDLVPGARAEATPVDDMRVTLKGLQEQSTAQKKVMDDAKARMEANRPKGRAPLEPSKDRNGKITGDPQYFDAKREYDQASSALEKLNTRVDETQTKIEGALKQTESKAGGASLKKQLDEKSFLQSALPYAGPIVGGTAGYLGGMGIKSLTKFLDKSGVETANKLLPGTGKAKPINDRISRINDFYNKGGSDVPPFTEAGAAPWWKANQKGVSAPNDLYPARSRGLDWTANAGLTGVYGGEAALGYKWGEDAHAEQKAATEAFNADKSEGNVQRLLKAERDVEIADFMLRMGLTGGLAQGVKGSVGIAGTPAPRPNVAKAQAERTDIRQALAASKAKAKAKAEKAEGRGSSKKESEPPRSPNGAAHLLPLGLLPPITSIGDQDLQSSLPSASYALPASYDADHASGGTVNKPSKHHSHYQPRDEMARFAGGPVYEKPRTSQGNGAGTADRKMGGLVDSALETARRYAKGGAVRVGAMTGATGGRDDKLPVDVPAGSYVVPADAVSGMPGAGNNTAAGFKILEKMFGKSQPRRAQGGAVAIRISDGEFIVPPEQVARIGGGSMEKGHAMLDAMVHKVRAEHVKTLSQLPGPQR